MALPPVLPLIARDLHLTLTQLGVLISATSLGQLTLLIPVGYLVDRCGPRAVLLPGLIVVAGGTALVGTTGHYPLLLAYALLAGLGQAVFHPADYAALASMAGPGEQGRLYSYHNFAGNIGFVGAPLLYSFLGTSIGWQAALVATGAAGLALSPLLALVPAKPPARSPLPSAADAGHGPTLRQLFLQPAIVGAFMFFMLSSMAGQGMRGFGATFLVDAYHLDLRVANLVVAIFLSMATVGSLMGGALADRYSPWRIILTTLPLAALATAALWARPLGFTILVGLFAVIGIAYGISQPSRDKTVWQLTPPEHMGKAFAFVTLGISLGSLLAPSLIGYVFDHAGARAGIGMVAVFFACTLAIAWGEHRYARPSGDRRRAGRADVGDAGGETRP